jgi:two-component system OmpR family sensor kinase
LTSRLPIRGFRAGFLVVVALLTTATAFILYSARRTNERTDRLVAASMERERLIGLLRLDASLLAQAADDHINASDDSERESADKALGVILREVQSSSDKYTADLPRSEVGTWLKLKETSEKLVRTVDVTVKYSNRKEAERARKHLEEEVKPINFQLDEVADELARQNAEETQKLLHQLQDLRLRSTQAAVAVVGLAVVLSLLVALQVTRLLKRQERTISEQMAELGRRNQELDSFASRVAHDLVSPLSPLKGYLTLARRQSSDPATQELLTQAESSTSRMSELVEALLRFCRAGKPSERATSELDTAVSTILLEQSQAAAASGVLLERSLERVTVACSGTLLQSIAQNLVSNAVKYSAGRPGARVMVRVGIEKGEGVLEVSDNGPGMSAESRRLLFTPFFRAPEARGTPGYGLGLATTKRLVEAHGGTLELLTTEGLGTQVRVWLKVTEPFTPGTADARARIQRQTASEP